MARLATSPVVPVIATTIVSQASKPSAVFDYLTRHSTAAHLTCFLPPSRRTVFFPPTLIRHTLASGDKPSNDPGASIMAVLQGRVTLLTGGGGASASLSL